MEGFVIRVLPVSWYDGKDSDAACSDPSRTRIIERAAVFASRQLAEKKVSKLRKEYSQRTFEIESR